MLRLRFTRILVSIFNNDLFFQQVNEWKFVAMVLDRVFFWVFASASVIGTVGILLQAPTIYDDRVSLTAETAQFGYC